MSLAKKLSSSFDSEIRSRGDKYFEEGRVRIRKGSVSQVQARVRGSSLYEVNLDWAGGVLSAYCECAYFESSGACKHLWAVILAADARGYLSLTNPFRTLILDCHEFDLTGDADGIDEEPEDGAAVAEDPAAKPLQKTPAWKDQLFSVARRQLIAGNTSEVWPSRRELVYVVDAPASMAAGALILKFASRDRKPDGTWGRTSPLALKRYQIALLPLPEDRDILSAAAGGIQYYVWGSSGGHADVPASLLVSYPLAVSVMQRAARTGRCYLAEDAGLDGLASVVWDEGGTWKFAMELRRLESQDWAVTGFLRRGEERMDLSAIRLLTQGGLVFTDNLVAPLAEDAPFEWMSHLRSVGDIVAPDKDRDELLATLLCAPGLPAVEVPEDLRVEEVIFTPRPCLKIRADSRPGRDGKLRGELLFDYGGRLVPSVEPARAFFDAEGRRLLRRDSDAEKAASLLLGEVGAKFNPGNYWDASPRWELAPARLPRVVRPLVEAGWHIEADGKAFQRPGSFNVGVSSGVDWFELHATVDYGGTTAKLPALLAALRRGDSMVQLDDGSYGMLPEDWLRRLGPLAAMGAPEDGHIRFRRSQAGLLDALLATQPEVSCDETFARVRDELRQFQGIPAVAQPEGFVGTLRDYQREGVGWMEFLRRFSFGGCLADDMGVGKTAQVLALFETRRALRQQGEPVGPSLVVVPRSLVFNWKEEAARFTPQLRVLDYTGLQRNGDDFSAYDVILATYGTLRRDILHMKDVDFDYIVLDEGQAIKNANTESAKAARLLRGANRLVLSGTPVENHLGELWSLFEFLNPGMLGAASVFKLAGAAGRNPDEDTRALLAHALRPFILRRTKEQVARELPAKTEQTVYCEMEPAQRKLYNELRKHYREALLHRIATEGMAKSKIQVLEALLRLRQAACHPGLIDSKRRGEGSAKLDTLIEQLREVIDEGHKALVFSQFTSLLSIVRDRLDNIGEVYEYLDGATRDRQAPVARFQNDPDCRLFLISLKAGGLGLNLTAAEYVFLLDPWWNPAVEAQAVDRAHRIGQTRQVFAYRLIARDTVEEKVLELQKTKRDLAAAIIGADNSLISDLRREDLELLLS